MLWIVDGKEQKTPSTYKANIEDTDHESYTSTVTGALIDNPIAVGMLKLEMHWDYVTEEEAEQLLQLTYKNPLICTIKCPAVQGGMLNNAKFRVSKRTAEMIKTEKGQGTSKSIYQVSFNMMQKSLTEQQKTTVKNA